MEAGAATASFGIEQEMSTLSEFQHNQVQVLIVSEPLNGEPEVQRLRVAEQEGAATGFELVTLITTSLESGVEPVQVTL